jgi:hypothetical protein
VGPCFHDCIRNLPHVPDGEEKLASWGPGRYRPKTASSCRDHPRRRHDFHDREVVRVRPEAALRPPFLAGEAIGHLNQDKAEEEAIGKEMTVRGTDESMTMTLEPLPILLR